MTELLLRARFVLPVATPPLARGEVRIAGGRILEVGQRLGGSALDLGDVAILPGLVNAHTHLEFTPCREPLGTPRMPLAQWIGQVIGWRRQRDEQLASAGIELQADRKRSMRAGLAESVRAGTTLLADIVTPPWLDGAEVAPTGDSSAPVTLPLAEIIGMRREVHDQRIAALEAWLADRSGVGISPHAPYTVHPELLDRLVELARRRQLGVAMHLAESPDELELLATQPGRFYELLSGMGFWEPTAMPTAMRPLDYLRSLARAPRALVVHGNYLDEAELRLLADHRTTMSVVYCPRTHAYFGHAPYPLARAIRLGARVVLGTDSRASNPDLSLLAEMRHVARQHGDVPPETVLEMGTRHAAESLGCPRRVGMLVPGAPADLAVVALPSGLLRDPYAWLFDAGAVGADSDRAAATMLSGTWVWQAPTQHQRHTLRRGRVAVTKPSAAWLVGRGRP